MPNSIMDKVKAAKAAVAAISPEEAKSLVASGEATLIDVRDGGEVAQSGKAAGALNISRGMIEFRADTGLPTHHEELKPEKTVIVYCATGGRAALAGVALQELGYTDVRNLGAFKDWVEAGGAVDT